MVLVSYAERSRFIRRTRPRMNAKGNFITIRVFASVYAYKFPETNNNYIKWVPYRHPFSKAYGYTYLGGLKYPLINIGSAPSTEIVHTIDGIDPSAVPILPTSDIISSLPSKPIPPNLIAPIDLLSSQPLKTTPSSPAIPEVLPLANIPAGETPTQAQPFQAGDAFQVLTKTTRQQVFSTPLKVKQVFIKAKSTNANSIWYKYKPDVAIDNGWELIAGEGNVLNIDDLSDIWFLGVVANDKLQVQYFV